MWKFLRGGATVIPGATFIPESRVLPFIFHGSNIPDKNSKLVLYYKINLSKHNCQKNWILKTTTVQKIWIEKTIPGQNSKSY